LIKEIIKSNEFENLGDILKYLKEAFQAVLQEMLEAEMDTTLGYTKNDVHSKKTDNSRNGYTPKTVKTQMGLVELDIPRDHAGEFEPKIVPKYKRDISGI
jgi:transposase-like protein